MRCYDDPAQHPCALAVDARDDYPDEVALAVDCDEGRVTSRERGHHLGERENGRAVDLRLLQFEKIVAFGKEGELRRLGAVLGIADAAADQAETLIDALSPELVLGPAATEQVRLNAQARVDFLLLWTSLTSARVADLLGSSATNRSALAHKLARRGLIFCVRYKLEFRDYAAVAFGA